MPTAAASTVGAPPRLSPTKLPGPTLLASQAAAQQCPGSVVLAQAAAGKLPEQQHREVVAHVQQCAHCKKTLNQLAEQFSAWSGRFLYKGHLIWPNDWSWLAPYEKYLYPDAAGGQAKTRIIDRRFTLVQLARSIRHLQGSTAECGVLGGVGSAMICKTLEGTYQPAQRHWGFDSFEGLSQPEQIDISKHSWQKKGSLAISPQVALNNLADFEFCTLVKGWIPQCFQPASDQQFRLVHVDLDLYQPTLDSLAFLYPRTVPGGVFVFDDYGHLTCPGVRRAVDEFFSDKPEPVIESVCGTSFAYKAAGKT